MNRNWPFITWLPLLPKTLLRLIWPSKCHCVPWEPWILHLEGEDRVALCKRMKLVSPASPSPFCALSSFFVSPFPTRQNNAPVLFPSSCQSLPALHVPSPNRLSQCKLMQMKLKVTWGTQVTQVLSCYKHTKSHSVNAEVLVMVELKKREGTVNISSPWKLTNIEQKLTTTRESQ